MFEHDYKQFPELTNTQLEVLQFSSPHPQITEDFDALVVKVHDGDTITLRTGNRDFDFPLRMHDIDAPELSEGGTFARDWLKSKIEGQEVHIAINRANRVGKYGRLLGQVFFNGLDLGQEMLHLGMVSVFGLKNEGAIEDSSKFLNIQKWL